MYRSVVATDEVPDKHLHRAVPRSEHEDQMPSTGCEGRWRPASAASAARYDAIGLAALAAAVGGAGRSRHVEPRHRRDVERLGDVFAVPARRACGVPAVRPQ